MARKKKEKPDRKPDPKPEALPPPEEIKVKIKSKMTGNIFGETPVYKWPEKPENWRMDWPPERQKVDMATEFLTFELVGLPEGVRGEGAANWFKLKGKVNKPFTLVVIRLGQSPNCGEVLLEKKFEVGNIEFKHSFSYAMQLLEITYTFA